MKKKLIITESQYNKLQEFLFETTDVNHTLDFVNVGDVLKFKTNTGSDYRINVKHVDQNSNEILGDNHGKKIRFNFNSYNEQNKTLNYQQLDTNTQKYVDKTAEVIELDIERNGQVLPIPDVGGNKQPGQQPEPVGQPDDISKSVDLDPNAPVINKVKGYDDEDYKKMLKNIDAELESDVTFRKALFKQRSFLDRLTGKNPDGTGIIIANKLVNSYKDRDIDGFIKNHKARYKTLENYKLEYSIDDKVGHVLFEEDGEREAIVGILNEKNQRNLLDVNKKFSILVIKNISNEKIPNYFQCEISTYSIINGNSIKNNPISVNLQFLNSTGFKINNK